MKLQIKKASTDVTIYLYIQDSSSSTGAGLTGLVFNSAGLTCYYVRPLAAAAQLSLATVAAATSAHSDGGFKEVDATNMPGIYRLDLSDAVIATGVNSVTLLLKGATNMAQLPVEIELVAYDPQSASSLGLSNLDATVSSRASQTSVDTVDDFLDTEVAAIKAKTDNLPSDPADQSALEAILGTPVVTISADLADVESKVDDLEGRLTAARAGYLDNLNIGGTVASQASVDAVDNFVDTEVSAIKTVTDKLDDTLEDDAGTYRFTENALEQAPSGGGGGASASAIADAVWDEKIDEHLTDRSYGAHVAIHLPFVSPDIDYKRIKKVVTEVVDTLPAPIQPKEADLIPISEGLQALLTEIRAIKLPEIPTVDLNPIQRQIETLERAIKAIEIPETDFTETHQLIEARNEVLDQLADVQEEIKTFHLEDVRELLESGVEKVKTAVEEMNEKFDNTQMVILKNEPNQEPKLSVLEEYNKL